MTALVYKYSASYNLNKAVNGRVGQKSRGLTSAAQFVDVIYLDFSKDFDTVTWNSPEETDCSWLWQVHCLLLEKLAGCLGPEWWEWCHSSSWPDPGALLQSSAQRNSEDPLKFWRKGFDLSYVEKLGSHLPTVFRQQGEEVQSSAVRKKQLFVLGLWVCSEESAEVCDLHGTQLVQSFLK